MSCANVFMGVGMGVGGGAGGANTVHLYVASVPRPFPIAHVFKVGEAWDEALHVG